MNDGDELFNRIYHLPEELREHIYKYVTCQRLEVKRRQVSVCDIQLSLTKIKFKALWKSMKQQAEDLATNLMKGPLDHNCALLCFSVNLDWKYYSNDKSEQNRLRKLEYLPTFEQFHYRLQHE